MPQLKPINVIENANHEYSVYFKPGQTAFQVLWAMCALRREKPDGKVYSAYEYPPDEWADANDGKAATEIRVWQFNGGDLDVVSKYREKWHESSFIRDTVVALETGLGIPALNPLQVAAIEKLVPKGLDEIAAEIAKNNKKIRREQRALRTLGLEAPSEPHSPILLGKYNALRFLYNAGMRLPVQVVVEDFVRCVALREREILINHRRYPDVPGMQRSHDDELDEYINTLTWYLGGNPGQGQGSYGSARYARGRG